MENSLVHLESVLSYPFQDKGLLRLALMHRSAGKLNNERLEFLGDAVLHWVIADILYRALPDASEGSMTRLRSILVSRSSLKKVAEVMGLHQWVSLGPGIKDLDKTSVLGNTFEALLGAIYLDAGIEKAFNVISSLIEKWMGEQIRVLLKSKKIPQDPKTILQEWLQAQKYALPIYEIIEKSGRDHQCFFQVQCRVTDLGIEAYGQGRSRSEAEQKAAQAILKQKTCD